MSISKHLAAAEEYLVEALAGPPFDHEAMDKVRVAKQLVSGATRNQFLRQTIVRKLIVAQSYLEDPAIYAGVRIRLAIDELVR
jgi:hypothetical protein